MTKRAVVLGGGGARGPYQIGVWKALLELGIDFGIVTGSSVGALNGALMVQGDYQLAADLWENLTIRDVVAEIPDFSAPVGRSALIAFVRDTVEASGMDVTPLENMVRRAVNEELVRASDIEYGLVTCRYPLLRAVKLMKEDIPEGELIDYMMASSSWFPFFRKRTIDGVDYIDGAYSDNLPAEMAADCGATEIIAIDLQGVGIVHPFRRDIPVTYIRSHWNLGDMMAFDAQQARRNIAMGYLDGLKAYRRLEGNAYAFPLGGSRNNAYTLREAVNAIRRRTGISLYRNYQRLPRVQNQLRYRGRDHRFLPGYTRPCTLGMAVTTAAELAGELLRIPPETLYTFPRFNDLLLERLPGLRHPGGGRKTGQVLLGHIYRALRNSYIKGHAPDALRGLAALPSAEFVAANYLLALELANQLPEGAKL